MKTTLTVLLAAIAVNLSFVQMANATAPEAGEKNLLPEEAISKGLSLGMTVDELKEKRPAIQLNKEESFRKVYIEGDFSKSIDTVVCYLATDDKGAERVYEFILVLREGLDPLAFGKGAAGEPNFTYKGNPEWRFSGEKTGLGGETALWTFKNKLIVAFAMPGSEWEEGFVEAAE